VTGGLVAWKPHPLAVRVDRRHGAESVDHAKRDQARSPGQQPDASDPQVYAPHDQTAVKVLAQRALVSTKCRGPGEVHTTEHREVATQPGSSPRGIEATEHG
jgi:hypothetical protein